MKAHEAIGSRSLRRASRWGLGGLAAAALLLSACDSAEERKLGHYRHGLELLETGESSKALLEFTNAIRIDGDFIPAHRELGRLHLAAGRLPAAAAHFQQVADALPKDLDARLALARIYTDLKALAPARAAADAALEIAPEDPRALSLSAALDMMTDHTDRAAERARAALAADPGAVLARLVLVAERVRNEDPDGALGLLEAAPPPAEGEEAALGLELVRVRVLEGMGDLEAAGEALRSLAEFRPDDPELRLALARWHMRREPPDAAAAEAALRAAADLRPDDPQARLRVAEFLGDAQGPAAVRAELERLVAQGGRDAPLFERVLAAAEAAGGDRAAAVARLERIAAREGEGEAGDAARLLLARLLDGPEDVARRAALVETVLAHDPRNAEALTLRGAAAIREDRLDDAVQDLRAALERAPESAEVLELLAVAHARNGDSALAAERRALAVQASGAAPDPSLRYASQLLTEDRAGSAESVLLAALENAPRDRRLLAALGEARLRRSDWGGAREAALALAESGAAEAADRLRAAALFGEGQVQETVGVLEAAWRSRGTRDDLAALVQAHRAAGEPQRAETLLKQALEADPDDARALILLADVEAVAGRNDSTEELLRRAVTAAPENPRPYLLLSAFLRDLGRQAESEAVLEAGLEAAPQDRRLRLEKALRLERKGEAEAALAIHEQLHAEDPADLVAANNLASLLSDHREDAASLERAATVARRLRGSPVPAFQDTYGWTLHLTGESAQAVAVLRVSSPNLPDNALAQHHLGMAYAAIGQNVLAREQLARALELADAGAPFPRRAEAEATLERLRAQARETAPSGETDG